MDSSSVIPRELIPDIGQQPSPTRLTYKSEVPNRVKCTVSIWFGINRPMNRLRTGANAFLKQTWETAIVLIPMRMTPRHDCDMLLYAISSQ